MIRAIFFDLDGTLLDNDKRIPASAYEALEKCRERGIALFVATARPPILEKMLGWGASEEQLFSGESIVMGLVSGSESIWRIILCRGKSWNA